jgi:DNA repair protein RadC
MAASKIPSSPEAAPLKQVYADLVQTLQQEIGEEPLAGLLSRLRESGVEEALPIAAEEGVLRLLTRLGWLDAGRPEEQAKQAEELLRRFGEEVDRSPAVLSVLLRLYADGWYGLMPDGICTNPPRCRGCGVTRLCAWYNAPPPADSRLKHRPPVERLRQDGPAALTEEELLTLVIGSGQARRDAAEVAEELLGRYGELRKLGRASAAELESYASVSRPAAVRLLAAFALAERMDRESRRRGPVVRSGKDFYDLYHKRLRDLVQEVFLVVLLDQRNRVLRDVQISQGSLTGALVHPREVFAPAIRESAAAVAIVHNHPSGDCAPSQEDRAVTTRLRETAGVVGIRFLDHVIVGEGTYTSFVDEGLL